MDKKRFGEISAENLIQFALRKINKTEFSTCTASFDHSLVDGRILSLLLHPAIIIASTLFMADLFLSLKDPVNRNRETTPMIKNDGH